MSHCQRTELGESLARLCHVRYLYVTLRQPNHSLAYSGVRSGEQTTYLYADAGTAQDTNAKFSEASMFGTGPSIHTPRIQAYTLVQIPPLRCPGPRRVLAAEKPNG